ncbi:hypothetical protein CIRG_09977 [Coccidioides immitis RMSCC 2394]|uniref:Uncharacterized protein n=1 Tax=Coccidioides immitis RMSCC 2394 TaxID=404692 RepID=A0A0J6Y342_COCIT|nr:hypothetical protein CIRG_09977 [Coccidioides immitis RMSCC 2394]
MSGLKVNIQPELARCENTPNRWFAGYGVPRTLNSSLNFEPGTKAARVDPRTRVAQGLNAGSSIRVAVLCRQRSHGLNFPVAFANAYPQATMTARWAMWAPRAWPRPIIARITRSLGAYPTADAVSPLVKGKSQKAPRLDGRPEEAGNDQGLRSPLLPASSDNSETGKPAYMAKTDKVLYLIGERPGAKGCRSRRNSFIPQQLCLRAALPFAHGTSDRLPRKSHEFGCCSRSHSNPCSKAHADGTTRHHRSIDPPNIALADRFLPRAFKFVPGSDVAGIIPPPPPRLKPVGLRRTRDHTRRHSNWGGGSKHSGSITPRIIISAVPTKAKETHSANIKFRDHAKNCEAGNL